MSSSSASFTVSYDGDALQTHQMDVRDLGPALLSLGKLFDEANRVLNGEKVSIKVQVKAHQAGSFEILFEAVQTISSQLSCFLTGDFVTSALNLKELLFAGGAGLIWLICKLRGKTPNKIKDLKNGMVRIELEDESFQVPINLMRLYQDLPVREATQDVLNPLERNGIDSFTAKEGDKTLVSVDKESLKYFKPPEAQDELISQHEVVASYSISSLSFKEGKKWLLYDGNSIASMLVDDEEFLEKVNKNLISFSKGDTLLCHVKVTQYKTSKGLKNEYVVIKVIKHQKSSRQISLPFDNEDSGIE